MVKLIYNCGRWASAARAVYSRPCFTHKCCSRQIIAREKAIKKTRKINYHYSLDASRALPRFFDVRHMSLACGPYLLARISPVTSLFLNSSGNRSIRSKYSVYCNGILFLSMLTLCRLLIFAFLWTLWTTTLCVNLTMGFRTRGKPKNEQRKMA